MRILGPALDDTAFERNLFRLLNCELSAFDKVGEIGLEERKVGSRRLLGCDRRTPRHGIGAKPRR